jgi:predicted ATPase
VQFRHLLYQEAVYDDQLQATLRRRHERCAEALLRIGSAVWEYPAELIARHLLLGGRAEECIAWWQRAGERAAASAAHAEAVVHFETALNALSTLESRADRSPVELGLQLLYGASCSATYGYADERTLQAYHRATELGSAAPDTEMLLPALWGLWAYQVVRASHVPALELTTRCVTLAESAESGDARSVAAAISGAQHAFLPG